VSGVTATTPSRIRLSPEQRREQLLELGVRMLADRSLEELSIDLLAETAGISRGLLYHYFGGKQGFYEAVVQRAADDLYAQTAPPAEGEPLERLQASMEAYVDYVAANRTGYASLVRAAAGGNDALRAIYDTTFEALGSRFFEEDGGSLLIEDTPANRALIRGWQAMTEELTLTWCDDTSVMSRDDLLRVIAGSLPAVLAILD
jgi:AcrR family transcriptional regulator